MRGDAEAGGGDLLDAVVGAVTVGQRQVRVGVLPALAVRFFAPEFAIPISSASIIVAFIVSLMVGLVFGFLPARDAAKLNPTEALRYE